MPAGKAGVKAGRCGVRGGPGKNGQQTKTRHLLTGRKPVLGSRSGAILKWPLNRRDRLRRADRAQHDSECEWV